MRRKSTTKLPDPTQRGYGELQKSGRTRKQILEAAMGLLAEHGYAEFGAGAVAKRAGLTRAALIYHFSNRAALLEATVHFVTRRRIAKFLKAIEEVPQDERFVSEGMKVAWNYLQGEAFLAFCQLSTAAKTDPELNAVFEPALMEFDRARRAAAQSLFPEEFKSSPSFDLRRDLVRFTLEGLAQQGGLSFDAEKRRKSIIRILQLLTQTEEGQALLARAVEESEL